MAVKSPEAPRRRFALNAKSAPYVFVAPAVILFLTFTLYPIIASLVLSFQTREGGVQSFAGLDNYARLLNDNLFYTALQNTFLILVVQVPIMLSLALVLAVALNSALVRMKGFFRVSFFMPVVTSLVAYAIIFLILLNQDFGLVNYVLSLVGIDPVPWLTSGFWAKVSIILALTWRWMGYNMVIYLAGLQGIPQELYEAAAVDGANKWKQFTNITIPQLRPIILFTVVLSTIGTLQLFDEPFILTGGGPNNATLTITMYLYQNGFQFFDFGYASAIAYVLVLIIAVLSYVQIRFGGERD
jgi:lactose/L-arabinose transport system permease protein